MFQGDERLGNRSGKRQRRGNFAWIVKTNKIINLKKREKERGLEAKRGSAYL